MFFFEGKQELYEILSLLIIPIISCLPFCFKKSKYIWFAPLLDVVLFLAISAVFFPYYFQDFATQEYDFTTVYWVIFFIPIQLTVSLIITTAVYLLRKARTAKA